MRECPSDGAVLMVAVRSGVEIDYCLVYRGVWLDRGELDKIVALAHTPTGPVRPPALRPYRRRPASTTTVSPDRQNTPDRGDESWLADLFADAPPAEGDGP